MTTPTPDVRELIASEFARFLREEGAQQRPWDFADGLAALVTPVIRQQVAEEIAQAIDARSAAAYRGEFGYNDWDTGLVREGLDDAAAVARSHVQHRTEES